MTKHPSRKVINFRHLLGCDTIVIVERDRSLYVIPSVLSSQFIILVDIPQAVISHATLEI